MAEEVMRLALRRKEIAVILEGDDGEEKQYTLKELSGKQRNQYLDKMKARVKLGKDGQAESVSSFEGFQADLLVLCFYDAAGELVTAEEIESFPSSTQMDLFKMAQNLSGLDEGIDEEKNG